MSKPDPILPLLRALRDGPQTAADVVTTGRSKASVRASLSAMAATAGRGRMALVRVAGSVSNGKTGRRGAMVQLYALTDAGRARLLEVDGQIGAGT